VKKMVTLTPINLERNALVSQGDRWAERNPERDVYIDRVRDVLPLLPALDRDIIRLYVIDGLTQRQIQTIVGLTQQGVCRRINSATRRLEFLIGHPRIDELMQELLSECLTDRRQIAVLRRFAKTAHQSKVARAMGLSQQWTQTLYARALCRLLTSTTLLGQYLGAWFVMLAGQRHLYELPTIKPRIAARSRR
jgi:DNA-directed RNA polymerase specialized sigma subunit